MQRLRKQQGVMGVTVVGLVLLVGASYALAAEEPKKPSEQAAPPAASKAPTAKKESSEKKAPEKKSSEQKATEKKATDKKNSRKENRCKGRRSESKTFRCCDTGSTGAHIYLSGNRQPRPRPVMAKRRRSNP